MLELDAAFELVSAQKTAARQAQVPEEARGARGKQSQSIGKNTQTATGISARTAKQHVDHTEDLVLVSLH